MATGSRGSHWAILALCAALVAFVAATKVTSYDTWVHLSLGRWMHEHRAIPRTNLLSHTSPERPTVDHQWLFQAGLYGLCRLFGIPGLVLAKALAAGAAFAVVFATARRKGAGPVAAGLIVLVAAFAARFRLTLRPQVMAFLLVAMYLYLLERWRLGESWLLLLALLPLHVAWANLHGSVVVGCALPLAYAAGETLRRGASPWIRSVHPPPRPWRQVAALWGIAVVLVPVTLLNANGSAILTEPFALSQLQAESGLKEFLLDRSALSWAEMAGRHAFFGALAVLGIVTIVGSLVRKDVTEVVLVLGLMAAALHSRRFVGLFAVGAAPIIARNASAAAALLRGRRQLGLPHVIVTLSLAFIVMECGWRGIWREQPTGLGPAMEQLPEGELQWVQRHYPGGKLFNEWEHGGYIAWRTGRAVFLDSRGLLAYEASLVRAYREAWTSGEALAKLTERYGVTVALVGRPMLIQRLQADRRWVEVHRGPVCAVFVFHDETGGSGGPS